MLGPSQSNKRLTLKQRFHQNLFPLKVLRGTKVSQARIQTIKHELYQKTFIATIVKLIVDLITTAFYLDVLSRN